MIRRLLAALLLCAPGATYADPAEPAPHANTSAAALAADAAVLADALRTLHPGLHRYLSDAQFEDRYRQLRRELAGGATLDGAFLAYTRFVIAIRCGHTWPNPLNQPKSVASALLERADRLPVRFTVVGARFLVSDALPGSGVQSGDEILAIDGVDPVHVIRRLWPYLRADGSSDGKRRAQVGHDGGESAFDLYYGLIARPRGGARVLRVRHPGQRGTHQVRVALVPQKERDEALDASTAGARTAWQYRIDDDLAIVTMPTWALWNHPFDWHAWLDQTFADLAARRPSALVIDLRRNEGGDQTIAEQLLTLLTTRPTSYDTYEPRLAYDVVPERLRPMLTTWDRSFYDRREQVTPLDGGGYTLREHDPPRREILPAEHAYAGRVFVLTSPTMSSATFEFARIAQDTKIATLVGQATGGNRRGTNGGSFFFLKLPNTGITFDLPLVAALPRTAQPDSPVTPDVAVAPDLDLLAEGRDPDLEAVRASLRHTH